MQCAHAGVSMYHLQVTESPGDQLCEAYVIFQKHVR